MDWEQEEKQRLEIEKQHYTDWLARAEPRQRGSATFQKRAKDAAFAYARDAIISVQSVPAEASLSEVASKIAADVTHQGDETEPEFEIDSGRLSDDFDLHATRRDEKRITNLQIKRASRNDPEKRAREQAADTQARRHARLDPQPGQTSRAGC